MPEILTARQIALLTRLGKHMSLAGRFYLTGGTALAGFHLHHRYSEDLDFFSEQEVDMLALQVFFKQIQKELGFKGTEFQQSFNRNLFFLDFGNEVLKTEFTFFPFPRIEAGTKEYGVSVDSMLDIAVNKLFTIYQRTAARDYIDLYCIIRRTGMTMENLIMNAKAKFDWHIDPLQLGTQFVKAEGVQDYPRMVEPIPEPDWKTFFIEEAKRLKPQIIQ